MALSSLTLTYKAKKWAASYELADNDNNQEVTTYGVTYTVTKGVKAYFNAADFDVTDGMLVGLYVKF